MAPINTSLTEALKPLTQATTIDPKENGRRFCETYKDLALNSDKQFLATPLTKLPTGLEKGKFLAIDLGGSNLRIAVIQLLGDEWKGEGKKVRVDHMESWLVPETVKAGAVERLFEWIVDCMDTALPHWEDEPGPLTATLTWSFPQNQLTNSEVHIMQSGKGFSMKSEVGETNIGKLLATAYNSAREKDPKLPPIEVTFITNDSISTLLSAAYLNHNPHLEEKGGVKRVLAGEILGTGSNATCIFPVSLLAESKRKNLPADATHSLLNTEWSIYGIQPALKPLWNEVDDELNKNSSNPGFQPFEHMASGRYLGELVRLWAHRVLEKSDPLLATKAFKEPYAFVSKNCSDLEAQPDAAARAQFLTDVLGAKIPEASAEALYAITKAVSDRAAICVASATAGLLLAGQTGADKDNGEEVLVAYTGSVLEKYNDFRRRAEEYLGRIVKGVKFIESWEGGVVGAAVGGGMVA